MGNVKFIKRTNKGALMLGLKEDESYMCLGNGESSVLVKVKDAEKGKDKFGSLTNDEFKNQYMPNCLCGCKEECEDKDCAHSIK